MAKDPTKSAQKWSTNLSGATQAISDGIDAVTQAPTMLAAKQVEVWASNTVASKAKFVRNLNAVTLADWQQAAKTKGIPRIQQGATEGMPKMLAHLTKFMPYVEAGARALPPRGNLQQNIARMVQQVNHNAKYAG